MSLQNENRDGKAALAEPIEIGKFFKNRKGDVVVVQIKSFEGTTFADIRQFFTGDDGVMRPTKKGVAIGLRRLEDLSALINKTITRARELGLLDGGGDKS